MILKQGNAYIFGISYTDCWACDIWLLGELMIYAIHWLNIQIEAKPYIIV